MNQSFKLNGRRAIVTGGASGIGEATSRVLTAAGASVIIFDIDAARAQALAAELPGASFEACDITNEDAVKAAFAKLDKLDILVNNAGIGHVGGIEDCELADFERLYRVNVQGVFLMSKYAVPLLKASHGSMVNIASVAGLIGIKKRFGYCATKGAVVAMSKQLAVEYPTELRVNCICPGTVDSPFVEGYLEKYHKHEKDKVRAEIAQRQPMGRLGKPSEIANLVLYMCADESGFMTGSVVTIDGGWTAA